MREGSTEGDNHHQCHWSVSIRGHTRRRISRVFFKSSPMDRYEFTIPRVGGDDDMSLDSDVVNLDGNNGRSDYMEVKQGLRS